jgi:phosphatidate cytidylyltransferase
MAASVLAQRIATAVVLVAILLPALLLLPTVATVALIGLLVAGGAWEWSAFVAGQVRARRLAYTALVVLALAAVGVAVPRVVPVAVVAGAGLAWWAAAFVLILRFPVAFDRPVVGLAGLLVLVPAWVALVALLGSGGDGRALLLVALAIVWGADVGAYFTGRAFGRVKLAPRVSPGKTWEGVLGGLACAALVAAAGAAWLGHRPLAAVPLGLAVGAISIVGDLTVSMFKRTAGLKDSGHLLPGHGGILDRVDSVSAAAPLFVLLAGWAGWLAA